MNNVLGKRIKELREKHGLTQDELAEKLKMNRANISNYERGVLTNIPSKVLDKLADLFNTTTDYLLGRTDNPERNNVLGDFENERKISEKDRALFRDFLNLPDEDKKFIIDAIEFAKRKRRKEQGNG